MAILLANTAIFRFATTRRKEIFSRKIGELFHQPSVGIFPRQGPPRRPRAQHAPRCCCQAYDCSIPVTHTWQRRGRCNYSKLAYDPITRGQASRLARQRAPQYLSRIYIRSRWILFCTSGAYLDTELEQKAVLCFQRTMIRLIIIRYQDRLYY